MPAGVSRYLDIAADLRARILNGEWAPGANLPRMMDLARWYGVNRDTLARAIAILETEGLLSAVPRRGTIVCRARSSPHIVARDWAAVAQAMKSRLAELDMTQAELIQRSRLAPMTIRELLFNTAQRRRSDQTLTAASEALGWSSDHLRAVAEGRGPDDPYVDDPVLAELAALKETVRAISSRLDAMELLVIEVRDGELLSTLERSARERGIASAAIVTLIGGVGSFTLSTMRADDATRNIITDYELPAEMTATGEIVDGRPNVHAVMAVEGDRAISGRLHKAQVGTSFVRAYLLAGAYGARGTERGSTDDEHGGREADQARDIPR